MGGATVPDAKRNPIRFILFFYILCFLPRVIEYLFLRTDQSVIGEAFIHKLIGIGLLAAAARMAGYSWRDIGFLRERAVSGVCLGLLLGGAVFAIAYGAEFSIQASAGNNPSLRFFVTSYAAQGNVEMRSGALFIAICVLGNIINVIMEEGVFRGLFIRAGEEKFSFAKAALLSAALFGFWHIMQPLRNVLDGVQSPAGALIMSLMLVGTSLLAGIQYALLYRAMGALWASMAAHFVNNAIVNLLHVVSVSGADELQTIRITIAQTLSFVVILVIFIIHVKKKSASNTQ
jgi:membrane protease YdiL (CAAX protease family)